MAERMLIVDDHPVVRGALRLALRHAWPDAELADAESLSAAQARVERGFTPDLIILDLCLPGSAGLSCIAAMRRSAPKAKIAVFSALDAEEIAASAFRLGADAVIPKTTATAEVVARLGETLATRGRGDRPELPASGGDRLRAAIDGLSAAQLRVLVALAEGRTNGEIATAVGVTEATVKAHLTAVYKRLGVSNRTQAVLVARPLRAG